MTPGFLEGIDSKAPAAWFTGLYEEPEHLGDEVAYAQRHDLLTYLPDDVLVKTDIASMAVGLELRPPLLDADLIGLGLGLPIDWRVSGRRGKVALRRAFGGLVPATVFRQPKRGFGVPVGSWLRRELAVEMQETLLDRGFLERGIIEPRAVHGLINDHLRCRDDHTHRLWCLLVLARWLSRT